MGQVRVAQVLGCPRAHLQCSVLRAGVPVAVGEGPIQLIMGDDSC